MDPCVSNREVCRTIMAVAKCRYNVISMESPNSAVEDDICQHASVTNEPGGIHQVHGLPIGLHKTTGVANLFNSHQVC